MSHAILFSVALLARGLAAVAVCYSDWLLRVLMENGELGCALLAEVGEFLTYLRESVTHQFIGGYHANY
ncbi:MAG: hypothetical protein JNM56_32545 [Planctomycetia bacterium]|nr:hypothetical protein [Planctomycetia bacterium]